VEGALEKAGELSFLPTSSKDIPHEFADKFARYDPRLQPLILDSLLNTARLILVFYKKQTAVSGRRSFDLSERVRAQLEDHKNVI